ncbi:MAG: hypothetical protein JW841_14600 [Deltaproteobacteria bacterium]|nr:hypothetical protein [Deltaproteobacteria bacterium]
MSVQLSENPTWEIGIAGTGLAGSLYRLRAEQATGVFLIHLGIQTVFLAITDGMPVRIDLHAYNPFTTETQRISDWYNRIKEITLEREVLAQHWHDLFALEDTMARFFEMPLPSAIKFNLPQDWMALIRTGLSVYELTESNLRRRLDSILNAKHRFALIEPVPVVLAELDSLESAIAAQLREGVSFVDILAAAHRFGSAQITSVLRAIYTLSSLGLLRITTAIKQVSANNLTKEQPGLAQLDIILAQQPNKNDEKVLGNIFMQANLP